jgi:hypothetical protein
MTIEIDRSPRWGRHGELRCIGQSDCGKHVMIRYKGAEVRAMPTKEWLELPRVSTREGTPK